MSPEEVNLATWLTATQVVLALGTVACAIALWLLRPALHTLGGHLSALTHAYRDDVTGREEDRAWRRQHAQEEREERERHEAAAERTQEEEALLAKAREVSAQNMALLTVTAGAISSTVEPSPALTEAAAEGFRLGRDAVRAQLKKGLQETRTPTP